MMIPTRKTPPLLLLTCLYFGLLSTSHADCKRQRTDLEARVSQVLDGDTLELSDATRIRFIGINAPEFSRHGKPDEAFAEQARARLVDLLNKTDNHVILQYGLDRHDRYGRTLAHVFLADGTNVSEQLLADGLSVRVAFPPNLWAQDCYQQAESRARTQKQGLWQHIVVPSEQLSAGSKGFHIIEGKIERIGHSKKSVWLNFKGGFAVRVARKDLEQFAGIDFKQLKDRTLQVRGWVYNHKNKNIMRLRHSSMLEIMK